MSVQTRLFLAGLAFGCGVAAVIVAVLLARSVLG
jgi:hypothetical protein